jgi:DHA2 family methylenomycin A resistance protein-like MFS transporter
MITLDATIVNVALGPIVSDVGGSLPAARWILNGYTLAFAALLLSAGALADRIAARAGFLTGLAIFLVNVPRRGLGRISARPPCRGDQAPPPSS